MSRDTQKMIETNEKIIEYLTNFHPFDERQCIQARAMYQEYLKNQKRLHTVMDDSDIEKLSFNIRSQGPNRPLIKRRIIELKSTACEVCGHQIVQTLNAHHTIPLASGGKNEISNYTILCSNCHRLVHNCTTAKWIDSKIFDFYGTRGTLTKLVKLIDQATPEGEQNIFKSIEKTKNGHWKVSKSKSDNFTFNSVEA